MAGLRKVAGAYLIGLAVVVAVYFIINRVLAESFGFDVVTTWYVLDVLMLIGLVLGLVFNYAAKRDATGPAPSEAVTRQYLEVNVLFYSTVAVTILFLHNWLSLLALGSDSLGRQPSGVGDLGSSGHAAADYAWHYGLSPLVRDLRVLRQLGHPRRPAQANK